MKKLLVILMLGAGFVTVASANEPLDCTNNTTNQCCVDVADLEETINAQSNHTIITQDGYSLEDVNTSELVNDGSDGTNCIDEAIYIDPSHRLYDVEVTWLPGDWVHSIRTN